MDKLENKPISWIQGGIMGIVSGMKGGAPAGALIGIVVLGFSAANAEVRSLWYYAMVVGLTLGLMGGAAFGAGYGFASGAISTRPFMSTLPVKATWYVIAFLLCAYALWQMLSDQLIVMVIIILMTTWLAGYFGSREFLAVLKMQHEPDDDSENGTQIEEATS